MNLVNYPKIKQIRNQKNLSQSSVAKSLGLSRPSYSLVESGIKELTVEQFYKLSDILQIRPQDLMTEAVEFKNEQLDNEKFKQVILACIEYGSDNDGKITKTKLAKLVYLSDFSWFYHHKESMTGAVYRAIQRGPVADEYFRVIDKLFEEQAISIEAKGAALLIGTVEQPPLDKLNEEELGLIKEICEEWQGKSTQEIVTFTHNQAPYKRTNIGDFIAYKQILREDSSKLFKG